MIPIFIYDLSLFFYHLFLGIAARFSKKAGRWSDGRKKAQHRLGQYATSAHGKKIWIHCASLGEFEQARPLIEKIRAEHPGHKLILTFFSPSGFDVRRYYEGVDFVGYLPLDTASDAERFIGRMKPSLVIWVKYEYWFHFLNELNKRHIPIVLISAVFRPDSIFFKWYGGLHREMLGYFEHIFVQNESSKALLQTIGIDSETCTDTRFDSVYNVMSRHKEMEKVQNFKGDQKVMIAGSTWPRDADMICDMINKDPFDIQMKYIIAPHNVTKATVDYILTKIKKRKTVLTGLRIDNAHKFEVIIIDSVGLLSSLYYYADIAYVGGGFNASVHNILEPAVYGMPVIFGPHYQKSEEAKALLSHPDWHAAYTVRKTTELISTVQSLLDNNEADLKLGSEKAKEYVLSNIGGTEKIYSYLLTNNLI